MDRTPADAFRRSSFDATYQSGGRDAYDTQDEGSMGRESRTNGNSPSSPGRSSLGSSGFGATGFGNPNFAHVSQDRGKWSNVKTAVMSKVRRSMSFTRTSSRPGSFRGRIDPMPSQWDHPSQTSRRPQYGGDAQPYGTPTTSYREDSYGSDDYEVSVAIQNSLDDHRGPRDAEAEDEDLRRAIEMSAREANAIGLPSMADETPSASMDNEPDLLNLDVPVEAPYEPPPTPSQQVMQLVDQMSQLQTGPQVTGTGMVSPQTHMLASNNSFLQPAMQHPIPMAPSPIVVHSHMMGSPPNSMAMVPHNSFDGLTGGGAPKQPPPTPPLHKALLPVVPTPSAAQAVVAAPVDPFADLVL